MEELVIGIILLSACLVLSCIVFVWRSVHDQMRLKTLGDTYDKIAGKTAAEAMPIIRRAYPGKTIRTLTEDEEVRTLKKYWQEDAVHVIVDDGGKIIGLDMPGGDGTGGEARHKKLETVH